MLSWLKIIQTRKSNQSENQKLILWRLDQQTSRLPDTKCHPWSKKISAIYIELHEFSHNLRETTKPKIVLTNNKSITQFFQTKAVSHAFWNACDSVLRFNFKQTHLAGLVITAADSFSRRQLKFTEILRLLIWVDIQTKPIEVTTSSSDIAEESVLFHLNTQRELVKKTIGKKNQSRQAAKNG